eukprot:5084699-Prorocentrum_lima.AAC.1
MSHNRFDVEDRVVRALEDRGGAFDGRANQAEVRAAQIILKYAADNADSNDQSLNQGGAASVDPGVVGARGLLE